MEATEKKIDFNHSPWVKKGQCNNNNILDDKDSFCDENREVKTKSAKCQCHCNQQQHPVPAIELPPVESDARDGKAGEVVDVADDGLQMPQREATNGTGPNDDEDDLLSTALAAHSPPNSNRTSVNNSTDNLSYNSDNYYVDELIVLQNTLSDEDVSLNSDDCIYAYRGGAEFDIALEPRNSNNAEDETDFLEMDFDPDPSSEVDPSMELRSLQYPPSIFLSSSVGGGSGSVSVGGGIPIPERQLFSSPTEGGESTLCHRCPTNKDFANLSLNLTQIQSTSIDADEERTSPVTVSCTTDDSKTKVSGTKPKRLSERSISMTKNRKAQFLYSKMNKSSGNAAPPSLSSATSLDERNSAVGFPPLHSSNAYTRRDLSDETCLDCLENEFLANTIGKPVEWSQCPKCKNKRNFLLQTTFGNNKSTSRNTSSNSGLGLSSSSSVLCCKPSTSSSLNFDLNDSQPSTSKQAIAAINAGNVSGGGSERKVNTDQEKQQAHKNYQRTSSCDRYDGDEHSKRTDKVASTFSILNVDENTLVQALDKLNIPYKKELITSYFQAPQPEFKDLKQFILHQSKKNCNHPKLKKLIELACNDAVTVDYQPDEHIMHSEMVQVLVADILHQWTRKNNLELLKQLDKRFIECNILGKIIYIIRQAQQRNNAKPLAEYILIPQYYKSGYISIVTKK